MIVDTVRGYKIPFILLPRQSWLPNSFQLIKERPNWPKEDQFLSSLFLAKKDRRNSAVVSLKDLNRNIMYQHFKMEGLFLLKEMLLPGDTIRKIDLKDAYFAIPCQ